MSELLGVSDATVYQYNAELRKLAEELNLSHIQFVRVQDLLLAGAAKACNTESEIPRPTGHLSESGYVANASETRRAFSLVNIGDFDPNHQIKSDEGALRTYQGYLRFLKLDLEGSQLLIRNMDGHVSKTDSPVRVSRRERERIISGIAKQMMANGAVCSVYFH